MDDDKTADVIDITAHVKGFEFSDNDREIIDSLSDENEELIQLLICLSENADNLTEYLLRYYHDDCAMMSLVVCLKKYVDKAREVIV